LAQETSHFKKFYTRVAASGEKIVKNATFLAMTAENRETFLKKVIFLLQICLAAHIIGGS
jgi:hypothetical protein